MKVLIVVTHLLGAGHLSRALTLARAFAAEGHAVRVASGGMPVAAMTAEGVGLVQLPPLRSDGTDFSRLLDETGAPAGAAVMAARRAALLALLDDPPDVLITELFPFGRRVLAGEFLALLEAAGRLHPRPVILCSVRDILAPPSKPARVAETEARLAAHYDAVLVHSDSQATPLSASWPVGAALEPLLRYTGFVAPAPAEPHPDHAGEAEVLVSAGGGPVGDDLFRAAIEAARGGARRWRLLVGGAEPGARIAALLAEAGDAPVVVESTRPDFRQMLHHAACSVSLCGYNTALDVLQSGVPAVFVPFDAGKEVEQGLRAESLAGLPGVAVLRSAQLTGAALAQAVERMIAAGRRAPGVAAMDGAAESVRIARALAEARR